MIFRYKSCFIYHESEFIVEMVLTESLRTEKDEPISFVDYAPRVFYKIRQMFNISDDEFQVDINSSSHV